MKSRSTALWYEILSSSVLRPAGRAGNPPGCGFKERLLALAAAEEEHAGGEGGAGASAGAGGGEGNLGFSLLLSL